MTTDPVIDAPTPAPAMPSRAIARRALTLPVAVHYRNDGDVAWYTVASGSVPGATYTVLPPNPIPENSSWLCDCIGGQSGHDCSHVWAARAHADPAVRRALLAVTRPARRMSRDAAEKLANDYAQAAIWRDAESSFVPEGRPTLAAKRFAKFRARIIARLTGHAADDGEGAA